MQEFNSNDMLLADRDDFFDNNFSATDMSDSETGFIDASASDFNAEFSKYGAVETNVISSYANKMKSNLTVLSGTRGSRPFKQFTLTLASLAGKIAGNAITPNTELQKALYPGLKQYIIPDKRVKARISRDIVKAVLDELFPNMNPSTKASFSVIKAGLMSRESSWNTFILENSSVNWKGGVIPIMSDGAKYKESVGGFGLVQWTGARHKGFADTFTNSFNPTDLPWATIDPRMQLLYFVLEMASFMPGCEKFGFKYNGNNFSKECIKIFTDPNYDVTFGELAALLYFAQSGLGSGWSFPEKIIWGNPSMDWAYLGKTRNHRGGLTSKDLSLLESYGFQGWFSAHKYLDARITSDELESGAVRFFNSKSAAQIRSQKKAVTYITTPRGVKKIRNDENWLNYYNL